MPILKVPVHYNFGIVSHNEHKNFHQRLLAKYLKEYTLKMKKKKHRNPFELTEEFIVDFNNALKTKRKVTFIELAKKMLARCKRRSGLSTLGCGKYVDLPVAWTEAIMLSQCKGEIGEEALELLETSLDHAPLAPEHIPVLFFIAESTLYKLCYDAAQKPILFSYEIKLSKYIYEPQIIIIQKATATVLKHYFEPPGARETLLGFLVFLRLLLLYFFDYQKFSGEHKSRLQTGLKALIACEICYQPYPNILLMLQFMLKAGEIICETGVLSESLSESQENLEEIEDKAFLATTSMSTCPAVGLNSKSQPFKIKSFLWHSLLLWVCVQNSCSKIDDVIMHVLFYKEQLHQKNWLESVLALMVLGETAKLNMSCLKVLMDIVNYFISSSVRLQKQEKNNKKNIFCWHWQVVYMYTNILRGICLHGINADLQKTAFLGFCDCLKEYEDDKELRGASFLELLDFCSPSDDYNDPFWIIRYGVTYNLVILRSELSGDMIREGLRNAVWRSLQKQKGIEKDSRVLDAAIVAEIIGFLKIQLSENARSTGILKAVQQVQNKRQQAMIPNSYSIEKSVIMEKQEIIQVEAKGQISTFLPSKDSSHTYLISSHYIGWRVTTAMCHHFLPPIGPNIPLPRLPERKPLSKPHRELIPVVKKTKRLSLREELLQAGVPKYPYPDYFTRMDMLLRRIIDAQWEKELQIRFTLEEKLQELELQEKKKLEEERFRKVMRWRFQKLHKTTKPYELPWRQEDEDVIEAKSSPQLSNV